MKIYNTVFAFFILFNGFGQDYKGSINEIKEDGLYKIKLTQDIRSASNENFNTLRIKNTSDKEIPYVLVFNTDRKFSKFTSIPIASKSIIKDSITSIGLENTSGKKREHIILKISNTAITKNYSVLGSNDEKNWFGLVSNKRLTHITSSKNLDVEKTINFPLNSYRYLRIDFDDSYSLPIEILEAGIYTSETFKQNPVEIENYQLNINQNEENKTTLLNFSADIASKIDYISFEINTKFYLRNAKIFTKRTRKVKKREETYNHAIDQIQLNSNNNNTFILRNLNEKSFTIAIENKDNLPLDIINVKLFQKPLYLISSLNKTDNYSIEIDKSLKKPSYNLGNFISNKTTGIKSIGVSNFRKLTVVTDTKNQAFWQTPMFMWICIVLGGLLVVYFALSLIKDIGKDTTNT
ncbi:hypothetical protein [Tenacibaculum jejuense]|uniref:DUF3999 domain-containing protein n=1 Tax=Tenacibaculum jejuense TaxID=584609 RepID=A0A238U6T1_9FLAO|nr:hypothetical protein [Tenacibaculum jejuense]SNR14090.1 conserved protein of unknown function [Tenacibaculum jejuense]